VVNIFDERGELIRTLCGTLSAPQSLSFTFTVSSFTPNSTGTGGTLTFYVNGQAVATWDATDKNGKTVPNSFYHLVLDQRLTDGTLALRAKDIFISTASQTSSIQLLAYPNIAHAGDVLHLSVAFGVNAADGRSNIKIYTVSGELVRTLALSNGQATWNLTNAQGQTVSSGIYLIVLDGVDVNTGNRATKVIKVVVLR
jgi:flagellar hook assembly protein FlgD